MSSSVSAADFPIPPTGTSHDDTSNYNHQQHNNNYNYHDASGKDDEGPVRPVVDNILLYSRLLLSDNDKAPLFYFTIASIMFTVVELVTALLGSSLALGFSGLHSAYIAFGFTIALSSSVISSRPAPRYSFGYQRVTVLLRFANATYLVFVCFSVITEGIQHSLGHIHAHKYPNLIMLCAAISFTLKAFGYFLFKRHHFYHQYSSFKSTSVSSPASAAQSSSSSSSPSPSPSPLPMPSATPAPSPFHHLSSAVAPLFSNKGTLRVRVSRTLTRVFRLIADCMPRDAVSDCAPSACVILSVLTGRWVEAANLYFAVVAAGLVGYLSIEELSSSAFILLQTTPENVQSALETCLLQASTVDGVLECHNMHWWTLREGVVVGSLAVRVRSEADEQSVLIQVHRHFAPVVSQLTVQIEKDDWHASPMTGGGGGREENPANNNVNNNNNNNNINTDTDTEHSLHHYRSDATPPQDSQQYQQQHFNDGVSLRRDKGINEDINKNSKVTQETTTDKQSEQKIK